MASFYVVAKLPDEPMKAWRNIKERGFKMDQELQKLGDASKELRSKLFDLENTILQMREYIHNVEDVDEAGVNKRVSAEYYKTINVRMALTDLVEEFNRKYS